MLKQCVSPYFLKISFLMIYSLAMLCKCICIHLYLHLKTSCICRINQRLRVSVCVHKLYCGCALHNVQSVITNSGLCTFFSSPTNFPLFTFFSDCRKITMMISTVADDIYIMMQCLSVCHEKWSLPPGSFLWPPELPITTLYNSGLVLMVLDWFFMVQFRFL